MAQCETSHSIRKTYLVVDDHAGFRRALRSYLPGEIFQVVECADGREASEAFARYLPDWTIMDVEMPGLDGLAATREILRQFAMARVVIVTQHDTAEYRREARNAGACAFVSKENLSQLTAILGQADSPTPGLSPTKEP